MKKNNSIVVQNLSVSYKSMKAFKIKTNLFKMWRKKDVFWALKDISFEIEKGSVVGIIGMNGSGKTTLLKTIAGIFSPDIGIVDIKQNSVALLSIGLGFNTELSGYENIILSGLLLGFTKEQINSKIKEIIDFSELGDFIYKPVKTYSSGMHSKLAFSITALLDTDILLIDEVLSVGDMNFKEKSYAKIKEIIEKKDKTVIIVSHSLSTIEEICNKVLWINKGKLMEYGKTSEVVDKYKEFMDKNKE